MGNQVFRSLVALSLLTPVAAFTHTTDHDVRPPVNYSTLVPPAPGQSYLDPAIVTEIRRVSDARIQHKPADPGMQGFIVNEWPTMSPFKHDDPRILLQH